MGQSWSELVILRRKRQRVDKRPVAWLRPHAWIRLQTTNRFGVVDKLLGGASSARTGRGRWRNSTNSSNRRWCDGGRRRWEMREKSRSQEVEKSRSRGDRRHCLELRFPPAGLRPPGAQDDVTGGAGAGLERPFHVTEEARRRLLAGEVQVLRVGYDLRA
jgi:hypothetical protein